MQFYFIEGNNRKGPFTIDELKSLEFNENTLFWHEGLEDWTEAKKRFLSRHKYLPIHCQFQV